MKPRNPPRKGQAKPAGGRPRQIEPAAPAPEPAEPETDALPDTETERQRPATAGVDYTLVEPRRILAAIAIDDAAPPGARVFDLRSAAVA